MPSFHSLSFLKNVGKRSNLATGAFAQKNDRVNFKTAPKSGKKCIYGVNVQPESSRSNSEERPRRCSTHVEQRRSEEQLSSAASFLPSAQLHLHPSRCTSDNHHLCCTPTCPIGRLRPRSKRDQTH